MNNRKTITVTSEALYELKKFGLFGETYTDLVLRLLKTIKNFEEDEKKIE